MDNLVLFLVLVGFPWISLHLIYCWLYIGLLELPLLCYDPCTPNFFRTFRGVGFCQKLFLYLMRWLCEVSFFLQFVYLVDYWFLYIEPSLRFLEWILLIDGHFDAFLDSVCKYCICSYDQRGNSSVIFFVEPLCGLCIRVTVASWNELGWWNNLRSIGVNSSLRVW